MNAERLRADFVGEVFHRDINGDRFVSDRSPFHFLFLVRGPIAEVWRAQSERPPERWGPRPAAGDGKLELTKAPRSKTVAAGIPEGFPLRTAVEGVPLEARKRQGMPHRLPPFISRVLLRLPGILVVEFLAELDDFAFEGFEAIGDRIGDVDMVHGGFGQPLPFGLNDTCRHADHRGIGRH